MLFYHLLPLVIGFGMGLSEVQDGNRGDVVMLVWPVGTWLAWWAMRRFLPHWLEPL